MRVVFCGVRGSTPAPGADFVRYGGHTSSVALAHDGHRPTLVLDGGTGIRNVTGLLAGQPFRGTVLLGHLHWDHTHGLPFFAAGNRPDSDVTVVVPAQGGPAADNAERVLERAFSPPHFPVTPAQMGWRVTSIDAGDHVLEGFRVMAAEIPHKGGRTFGYRVSDDEGRGTLAYLSDHSPVALGEGPDGLGAYHPAAMALARDVDVLVHDAQHTAAEYAAFRFLGHSAVEYAVGLAQAAGARTLVLFHHDPSRTDDQVDAILAAHQGGPVTVVAASEGMVLDL